MNNDWYEKGELPPVGEVVIAIDTHVKSGSIKCEIKYISKNVCVLYDIEDCCELVVPRSHVEFAPLITQEDKLVEQAKAICKSWDDSCGKSIPELFVEANWRPIKPMSEEKFVALICISFDVNEEFCRELYQAGCRFIEQGE